MRIYTTTRIPPDEDAPDGSETVDAGNPTDDYVEKAATVPFGREARTQPGRSSRYSAARL
jgi:hypothetical protein